MNFHDGFQSCLFVDVQVSGIFSDSKTFVDAIPKTDINDIEKEYVSAKSLEGFSLENFIKSNFYLPRDCDNKERSTDFSTISDYIESLWPALSRKDSDEKYSSLIPLPNSYVVPGGRFREIYYWDSYFTMLGLAQSGRVDLIESMVANFAYLIDTFGFVPNGNRTYFLSRSQPPFFVMMVELLDSLKSGDDIWSRFFPQLKKEYDFWMSGVEKLSGKGDAFRRVIRLSENNFLNRYWDDSVKPRPESFREDVDMVSLSSKEGGEIYRHIRSAAESGWDFSSRWFNDRQNIETINTTNVIPVDLNCLMHKIEVILSKLSLKHGDSQEAALLEERARNREQAIRTLFYDENEAFFVDLLMPNLEKSKVLSLAGASPLFFNQASDEQAKEVAKTLKKSFLKPGGWVQSTIYSGQQWDAPNGWAPSQWMVYRGLLNYQMQEDAIEGARRWTENVTNKFKKTGKILEKYNVEEPEILASGGEYMVQDGFGWTNGTFLCFVQELEVCSV